MVTVHGITCPVSASRTRPTTTASSFAWLAKDRVKQTAIKMAVAKREMSFLGILEISIGLCIISPGTCAPKNSPGATWEWILQATQPWLVKASGYCTFSRTKLNRETFDSA
jgi:hypothetical protein